MTIFYLADFLRNINETPWRMYTAQDVANGWLVICHVWFSYNYRKQFFRKEMIAVLTLLIILINAILLLEIINDPINLATLYLVLFSIYIFAYLWSIAVLLRKAGHGSYTTGTKNIKSAGRDNKAFRSFAWWSALFVVLWLNFIIPSAGIRVFYNVFMVFHTISLISLPWFAINYVNYAEEYTTFQVKLVGIMLCVTLLLLGLLGIPDFTPRIYFTNRRREACTGCCKHTCHVGTGNDIINYIIIQRVCKKEPASSIERSFRWRTTGKCRRFKC